MLDQSLVKLGTGYEVDGKTLYVNMIHTAGRGHGVSLSPLPNSHPDYYSEENYKNCTYMAMRKFQKIAKEINPCSN